MVLSLLVVLKGTLVDRVVYTPMSFVDPHLSQNSYILYTLRLALRSSMGETIFHIMCPFTDLLTVVDDTQKTHDSTAGAMLWVVLQGFGGSQQWLHHGIYKNKSSQRWSMVVTNQRI